MRLQDKFKKVFILPLICGILSSIILTVFILIIFSTYFSDKSLISRLEKIEKAKNNPILFTANNLIFKKFQKTIYSLFVLKDYYTFYAKSLSYNYNPDLIDKYVLNACSINRNYKSTIKNLENGVNNTNSTYLNNAFWFKNNTETDLKNIDPEDNFKKQLTVMTNLIPVLRSIYETTESNLANHIELIYFTNKNTGLYFGYPITSQNPSFFSIFDLMTNPSSCKTPEGLTPNFFYFYCSEFWQEVLKATVTPQQQDIVITQPYKLNGFLRFGITICIKLVDIFVNDPLEALSSICMDFDISELYTTFDSFNREMSGYFYLLRVESPIPIYYPMNGLNYAPDLSRYEFGINTAYYVEELANFNHFVLPQLIMKYEMNLGNGQTMIASNSSSYLKNGEVYNYTIYPIKLYTNNIEYEQLFHLLTLVYVHQPNTLQNSIQDFQTTLFPRLFIQIFLFSIMGAILILIAWYLITSIALNIVKPIKNLKYLIQGMNVNKAEIGLNQNLNGNGNGNANGNKLGNNNQKNRATLLRKNLRNDSVSDFYDINEEIKTEELEYDEETLEMRSSEMDKLFNILLKLKNVLTFTTNSKTVYDKNAFINYVNAKYTFNEVSNLKGQNVCDSNVGNLALRSHKYDKAIFHLIESLPEHKKNIGMRTISNESFFKIISVFICNLKTSMPSFNKFSTKLKNKSSFNSISGSSNKGLEVINNQNSDLETNTCNINKTINYPNVTNSNLIKENSRNKNKDILNNSSTNTITNRNKIELIKKDTNQTVILESRYPKLLYSYKKLFRIFRQILKQIYLDQKIFSESSSLLLNFSKETITQKLTEELTKLDLYVVKDRHSLEAYENYLMDYIKESTIVGDTRRTAEALLEYIDFLIIFKLKDDSNIGSFFDSSLLRESGSTQKNEKASDSNELNPIQQNKIQILENIGKYFKHFDALYDLLKQNCSSEYFKAFLDSLRRDRKENLETIETPFLVLFQRSNYLKGKLANTCGHYDKALEYFHLARETLIICDASIIKKSIKQIIKIMKYLKEEIEKDIEYAIETNGKYLNILDNKENNNNNNNLRKTNTNMNTNIRLNVVSLSQTINPNSNSNSNSNVNLNNPEKKLKDQVDNLKDRVKEIDSYILNNLDQLSNFSYIPKDLIILIDVSDSMRTDSKKIKKALRTSNEFFEQYITVDDRFGLFVYSSSINPIISLTSKNFNSYICVKNLIEGMLQDPQFGVRSSFNNFYNLNSEKTNSSCTCKAISHAYEYLKKKNPDLKKREKWIIVFTDSFNSEENPDKELRVFSELKHIREIKEDKINVITVGINMNKEESNRLRSNVNPISKKSDYLDFDNIGNFANILKEHGDIRQEIEYPNERYESDKIKR